MGIFDLYRQYLKKQDFPGIFRENLPRDIISLSVDFNGIIHNCAQVVYAYGDRIERLYGNYGIQKKLDRQRAMLEMTNEQLEKELFNSIGSSLYKLVASVAPKEYLLLAIDGVAPQAKITQQRSRRFKNSTGNINDKEIFSTPTTVPPSGEPTNNSGIIPQDIFIGMVLPPDKLNQMLSNPTISTIQTTSLSSAAAPYIPQHVNKIRFDPNCITPGTPFMIRLNVFMEDWINKNISRLCKVIYYSSHLSPGEGEHKIMDYFRSGKITGAGNHIVYGMDTDLIMLTMAMGLNNLYLWRDDINDIIDIDRLKYHLSLNMGNSPTAITDFILILFLFGNDFLPHQPSLGDFSVKVENMLNIYKHLYATYDLYYTNKDEISGTYSINWNNFKNYLYVVQQYEPDFLIIESKRDFIERTTFTAAETDGEFNYSNFRSAWYNNEFLPRLPQAQNTIIEYLGYDPFTVTTEKLSNMLKSYIDGLNWVFGYYLNGISSINIKWYYPYYHTPLFYDIYYYITNNEMPTGWQPLKNNNFSNVIQQLLSVLPTSSIDLLPPEARSFMSQGSPLIEYYPDTFVIDYELVDKYFKDGIWIEKTWKGVPILPFVDPYRVKDVIDKYFRLNLDKVQYYESKPDIKFIRNAVINEIVCNLGLNVRPPHRGHGRGQSGRGGRGRGRGRGSFAPQISYSVTPPGIQTDISYIQQ